MDLLRPARGIEDSLVKRRLNELHLLARNSAGDHIDHSEGGGLQGDSAHAPGINAGSAT